MEIQVTRKLEIRDGLHDGVIVAVEYRDKPYQYTDLVIEFPVLPGDKQMIRLKAGYPTAISTVSQLGKLITRFGKQLTFGETIDPEKILVGKPCHFMTLTEENKNGCFARIMPESVKPQ